MCLVGDPAKYPASLAGCLPFWGKLIDTGAHISVADASPLAFAGRDCPVQSDYLGASPASLSASVGTAVHGLVGGDILNQYDIRISLPGKTLTVSVEPLPLAGRLLQAGEVMGIPVIGAKVNAVPVKLFFDTGAKNGVIGGWDGRDPGHGDLSNARSNTGPPEKDHSAGEDSSGYPVT